MIQGNFTNSGVLGTLVREPTSHHSQLGMTWKSQNFEIPFGVPHVTDNCIRGSILGSLVRKLPYRGYSRDLFFFSDLCPTARQKAIRSIGFWALGLGPPFPINNQ